MRAYAMAKINLGLDILGKREDGYHEVRMIMQTIRMCDTLEFHKKEEPGITIETDTAVVPSDENNLVYRTAKMLMDEFGVKEGLTVKLEKFIPVAAGMAGGSADAAVTFTGVNELFQLGLTKEELMERAVKIGADVPYCIMGGTALAEGIGEKLTQIAKLPACYILVGKPKVAVSTKMAYGNLKLQEITERPDIDGMITDIQNGDLYSMIGKMANVFEPGIIRQYPVIQEIKDMMEANGALKAMMSGSGPTVFGIFDSKEKINAAEKVLRDSGLAEKVYAAEVYDPQMEDTNDK